MSFILLVEQAAPQTPSAAQAVIYVKSDGKFYTKDDAGTESLVSHANPITVADGGTGAATFTDAGVLIGNGTGAIQVTGAGTAGQILTSNGAGVDPTFQTSGTAATQAQQEAGTDLTVFSSPGRQHFHPSAAKAWVKFNSAGTIAASYNITSITDTDVGNWIVNLATDFSTANYCGLAFGGMTAAGAALNFNTYDQQVGTFSITAQIASTRTDPGDDDVINAVFYGDQA